MYAGVRMRLHRKDPDKPHFNSGSQCNVLKTKNFENVGFAGRESESSEDKYLTYKKLNYNKIFTFSLRKIPLPYPH